MCSSHPLHCIRVVCHLVWLWVPRVYACNLWSVSLLAVLSMLPPSSCSAQEGRYFARSKVMQIGEMEKYLEEHPHDVEAWLSFVEEVRKSFSDEKVGVTAAIKSE